MRSTVELLGKAEHIALTTFRADGRPVTTPVWAAECDGRLLIWTPGRSAKARRIRRTPRVTVAVCDSSGELRGPAALGTARLLPRSGRRAARRAMAASYGLRFHWFRLVLQLSRLRRAGGSPVAIEIALSPSGGGNRLEA
jgi:uncharacterized protein